MANAFSYLDDSARLAKIKIDSDIRLQAMNMMQFRTITRPIKAFGKNKGSQVEIEKFSKLPKVSTPISEKKNVPLQRSDINFVVATVEEYGSGTPWTSRAKTLAEYAIDEQLKSLIAINQKESMDSIVGAEFRTSDVFYTPTGLTTGTLDTDGTITTAAAANFTLSHLRDMLRHAKKNNMPKFDGNMYLYIASVDNLYSISSDETTGGWIDVHKYDMPEVLIKGEVGQFGGARIVEENNVLSGTLGTTSYNGEALLIGFDAVAEALVEPEHVEFEEWDFKRFHAIAWLALTGFKKVWDASEDGQFSIIRVWST